MRLLRLNDDGSCSLHEFPSGSNVRYAVLSHTWLPDKDDEVKFADINGQREDLERIKGYAKIRFCGAQAARDGLEYFWVDTCCIDKTNTVELQTAINSMFRWYQNATKCYVYLSDVSAPSDNTGRPAKVSLWAQQFRQSRWFTRGWTLQELLAPLVVEFFDVEGVRLGDKTSLEQLIHEITGIEPGALRNEPLEKFSIATRRSWAENRECTFPEDKAYCLLGIFSVFMPYIYGEEERAFERLLREIHNQTEAEGAQSDRLLDSLPRSETAAFNSRESELLGHSMCLQNTRIELLQDITDWATTLDDRCVYILDGIAGTGKSTIARTIARAQDDMNQLGGSFFFSKGGGDASQANVLFTTLAFQLAKKIGSTKRHICDAIKEHKDITRQSFRDQWEKLIVNPLKQSNTEARSSRPSTITLVLDALDECDHERDVAAILNVFASSKMAVDIGLRILITARPSTTTIRGGIRNIPESNRRGFKLQDVSPKVINRDLTLFFKTTLSNIGYERGFAVDWPSERSICRLVEISSGLFVWASTACRYIGRRRHFVESRMDEFIREHGTIGEPQEHLNQLYTTVLEEAAREYAAYSFKERAEVYKTLGKILGVIAVLFSPLSIDSLASLLDMRPNMITETLVDLHAILNIPGLGSQERDRPIRLHHPSFREFLLDESRCTEQAFQINEKDIHNLIADNCVRLMNERLVRDVCKLRSPGADKRNMDPARIQECLPADLQYACLHWAKHYRQGEMHLRDDDETHSFFKTHFLHWLEAMNVLGKSSEIAPIMRMYQSLLMPATNSKQVPFVKDSRKFIVNLQSKVDQSQSPLQIYASALVFVRDTNKIRDHFWTELHPFLNYVRIVKADGPEPKDDYNYVCDVAFTPDGTLLASGSLDEWVRVWDTSTGAVACKYEGQTDKISAIDISLDGQLLASGSDDFTVQIWNMDTKKTRYILKGHARWVNTVAFSPDRRWLASGSSDETVKLWDMETGEGFRSIEPNSDSVNSISYSPNGRFLAIGTSNNLIHIWDTLDQEFIQELSGHQGAVHSVQFSPDGLQILSGSDDTTIRFWEVGSSSWDRASEIETRVFKGHTSKVWAVAYSHNAEIIASGSEDMAIKIWDPISGDVLFTLKGHTSGINSVAFSPDDQRIASGSFNDDVMLWDVQGRELIGQFADFDEEQTAAPTAPRVQRSDSVLEPASSSRAHAAAVTVLTFSPGGDLIASGSDDTTIKFAPYDFLLANTCWPLAPTIGQCGSGP
ncbi:unnamed protein product [Zymoseptoria tritici ST99CH_3D7]|uniref:NACHT domain-containing protein n=1 Tax=Zymoseptoria tritici (strain ST99CH_3D7) TaxID=1276538 RepID=A0A1X7S0K5_ZYMT9|nr:unnamed protein product [Zymoseptoria tritici ST99CH_3D7]